MLETMYNNSRRMEMAVEWRMILENTENSNGAVVELVEGKFISFIQIIIIPFVHLYSAFYMLLLVEAFR
jgi:hypothetical protein